MKYWLLKTEPETFSIDDLARAKQQTTFWDGVRNYQARNFLRDQLKRGDLCFIYHSNDEPPGIVGLAEVVREGYPDPTAFDPRSPYYDEHSKPGNPRWYVVDIKLKRKFPAKITLDELRETKGLQGMELLRKGSRLSVQPVTNRQFAIIMAMVKD